MPTNNSYNYRSSTGYITRYNDCYILHPILTSTTPSGASVNNDKIVTTTIYFDQTQTTDDGTLPINNPIKVELTPNSTFNPQNLQALATKGCTVYYKHGQDGDDETAGNLRYNNVGTGWTAGGYTFNFVKGHAAALAIRSFVNAGQSITGTYTFYVRNKEPQNLDEIIWRVQVCFGSRDGSTPYSGTPYIVDGWTGYRDIISRGNSGGTYFHNFDALALGYTGPTRRDDGAVSGNDPGDWEVEYLP
jgi:hypothetical protein